MVSQNSPETASRSGQPRPSFPQELIDRFIDEVQLDRATLKACALTARAWLPRARSHLHRAATLYHQNCRIHPSQVEKVSKLLSLPLVSQYTQELLLEGKTDYALHHAAEANAVDYADLFWRVLARFTHVQTLRITRLFWVSHPLENKNRLCDAFPLVTALDVYMSDFADAQEFLSFLSAFPHLTRLKIERVFWAKSAEEWSRTSGSDPSSYRRLPEGRPPGAALRHLQVQHCDVLIMADVANHLVALPASLIETLHLSPPDGDDFEALPLYLGAIGTNLKHLILALEFSVKDHTLRQAMAGLEANARVESLTFLANYELGRKFIKAASMFWPCVKAVLTEIHTEHIRTIRFECHPEDLEDAIAWEVDEMLGRSVFKALENVTFAFAAVNGYGLEELVKMAGMAFASTFRLGFLTVLAF
ncbi:hypothetical protein PsYK624_046070 [Phanerochaete sordida]|uniref:Uncharacterized protein n=1 Tax=Phanerochaete sordida TaxID=48140 RepID=A0A9P3LBG1_9APHY|nr:hypothetical protein PsYK624_046070 [Phanerochaete sordida]